MDSLSLSILEQLPGRLLTARVADLWEILPGPTLIHLSGRRPERLFVSYDVTLEFLRGIFGMQTQILRFRKRSSLGENPRPAFSPFQ